jgi:hypothetical protein
VCGQLFRRESCPRGFVVRGWLAGSIPPLQQIFDIVQGLTPQRFRQRQGPLVDGFRGRHACDSNRLQSPCGTESLRTIRRLTTKLTTRSLLELTLLGALGHLCGLPTTLPRARQKTKKPLRRPLLSAHRRGFRSRGSGRSRTDDGGFAIRCLSHLATEPFQSRSNQPPLAVTLRQNGAFGQAVPVGLTWPVLPPNTAVPIPPRKSAAGPRFLQSVPANPAIYSGLFRAALHLGAAQTPHNRQTRAESADFGSDPKRPI